MASNSYLWFSIHINACQKVSKSATKGESWPFQQLHDPAGLITDWRKSEAGEYEQQRMWMNMRRYGDWILERLREDIEGSDILIVLSEHV